MSDKYLRKILSTAIAATLVTEAVPLLAQTGALEEVVVTARKREESILKVPVTVSAYSGETLQEFAITDVKGIAEITPGLNFSDGPLSSGVLVSMRGIGTGSNNPAVEQSVALVVDGMQFTQGLAFKASSFDMAGVEVMKGPQALFFGKAAPAGVIAIRTNDPGENAEISVRGGYEFEAEEQQYELILSGPVTDTLGLRLAAQYSDSEGYFQNDAVLSNFTVPPIGTLGAAPVSEDNLPGTESVLLRGTAVWKPADSFSARLKMSYNDEDTQGTGGEPQLVSCPEGTDSLLNSRGGINFIGGQKCKLDDKNNFAYMIPGDFPGIYNNGKPFNELQQGFGSLELNYDMGHDLTLTSVTGYYDVTQKSMTPVNLTTQLGGPFVVQGKMDRNDFTQELRLTSDYSGAWNFMVGAFYQDSETKYLSQIPANQTYFALLGQALPPMLADIDSDIDGEALSFFGQVLWNITPDLELGVGTRWTDENRKDSVLNRFGELVGGSAVPVDIANKKIGDDNWSPEASLTWTPTGELTFYGNLKQAYKSGSFDVGGAIADGDDVSFVDERIRGGELGMKSLWLDGSVAFNAAGYYYRYDDMQVEANVFNPAEGVASVRTTNAASSDVYGVDTDVTYAPSQVQGLTLTASLNWNHAEYHKFDNAQCWTGQTQSQGCNIDLDGDGIGDGQNLKDQPLLRAPDWMANVRVQYEMPVFSDMTLRLGATSSYSDSYSASSENYVHAYQDDYVITSASVSLSGPGDRWKVEVIGDNLTDELFKSGCFPAGFANTLLLGESQGISGTGTVNGGPGGEPETACEVL